MIAVARPRPATVRPAPGAVPGWRDAAPCIACGTIWGHADRRTGKPTRTHGRCNACHHRYRKEVAAASPDATCAHCGAPFARNGSTRRHCSVACGHRAVSLRALARLAGAVRPCTTCGAIMRPEDCRTADEWHQKRFCSARCADRWHATQSGDAAYVPRGLVTAADLGIDPFEVATRLAEATLACDRAAALGELTANAWRWSHPEQFSGAALMRLFPTPEARACARFADRPSAEEAVA